VRLRVTTALPLLRIGFNYTLFAVLKHVVPLTGLVRWAWLPGRRASLSTGGLAVAAVSWIQRRALRGTRTDCLQAALVLYRELSRAGMDPHLVMGFARDAAGLVGHAWVEVGGAPVAETVDDVSRFTRTATFGTHGRRLDPGRRDS
jgi:hypothetical protein